MAGMPAQLWFDLAYLLLAAAIIWLMITHTRRALPFIPTNWLGKGQLLYLAFLWWMVVGNFERAVVSFAPQRLVTEGVVFLNALICTLILLLNARADGVERTIDQNPSGDFSALIKKTVAAGVIAMAVSVAADWGIVRAIYGDTFAGFAGKHIRFGPGATATTERTTASVNILLVKRWGIKPHFLTIPIRQQRCNAAPSLPFCFFASTVD
jgi:hypothetical protein